MSLKNVRAALRRKSNKKKAKILQWFFKTGPGEYAEGDKFIGVVVPDIRKIVKQYQELSLKQTLCLLRSKIHEERLTALLILVQQFSKTSEIDRGKIFQAYCKSARFINNWDLVDLSAPNIVGAFLWQKDRKILLVMAKSRNLWERRIAILATFYFIRQNDFKDTLAIAKQLLGDRHDLIHKAVGWMLREVGKRSPATEKKFLKKHYKIMPRTMLRYAIEKFPENERQSYLRGTA